MAQLAIIRQMSRQCRVAQLATIRQMSRQVSRGSAADYEADEQALREMEQWKIAFRFLVWVMGENDDAFHRKDLE